MTLQISAGRPRGKARRNRAPPPQPTPPRILRTGPRRRTPYGSRNTYHHPVIRRGPSTASCFADTANVQKCPAVEMVSLDLSLIVAPSWRPVAGHQVVPLVQHARHQVRRFPAHLRRQLAPFRLRIVGSKQVQLSGMTKAFGVSHRPLFLAQRNQAPPPSPHRPLRRKPQSRPNQGCQG